MIVSTYIKVSWSFEGFHMYPNAPEEVSFLKSMHRHIFKCSAKIQVEHDNRELEFFIVQRKLKSRFSDGSMNSMSCEMIASQIGFFIKDLYGERNMEIEVSEDGENSAIVEFTI